MLDRIQDALKALAIAAVALFVGAAALVWWLFSSGWSCAHEESQRLRSPDGRWDAVVFDRNCGATTDYSTQVALVRQGSARPGRPGNAFRYAHHTPLVMRWLSPTTLEIRYPPGVAAFSMPSEVDGVQLRYRADREVREP